jgi:hypothetical protein
MRKVLIGGVLFIFATTPSLARTFGGYECTVDCFGHWLTSRTQRVALTRTTTGMKLSSHQGS